MKRRVSIVALCAFIICGLAIIRPHAAVTAPPCPVSFTSPDGQALKVDFNSRYGDMKRVFREELGYINARKSKTSPISASRFSLSNVKANQFALSAADVDASAGEHRHRPAFSAQRLHARDLFVLSA